MSAALGRYWCGLIALALALGAFAIAERVPPLSASHFDSPIYLYQSKRYADTRLVASFRHHAQDIADQVRTHRWPTSETYPEAFWRFMRLGNIALLGSVTKSSAPAAALARASQFYDGLLAASVGVSFLLLAGLCALCGVTFTRRLAVAAALSCLAWMLSPIFAYLAANLLSEIPALLCLVLCLLVYVRALLVRSMVLAALAGVLMFVLYAVRVDSLWSALVLVGLVTVAAVARQGVRALWPLALTCALSAATAFLVYVMTLAPLTDPRLVLELRRILLESRASAGPTPEYHAVPVAGGLLWIGTFAALFAGRARGLRALGLIALPLLLLPRIGSLFAGSLHSRAVSELMLPLLLLSTIGLEGLQLRAGSAHRGLRVAVGTMTLVATLALVPEAYTRLVEWPGLWRLQYVRHKLVPARFERMAFDVPALQALSSTIYADSVPTVLLRDPATRQEHFNIVRYFGPAYASTADMAMTPDITNPRHCAAPDLDGDWSNEPVLFCTGVDAAFLALAQARGLRLLQVSEAGRPALAVPEGFRRERALAAGEFTLYALSAR